MRVALLLANGFEEIEALMPLDLLRRADIHVDTIGIGGTLIEGAHGVKVVADIEDKDADASAYGMVILPGGMPGAKNLDGAAFVDKIISCTFNSGGRLAAICAAPMILGHRGLLDGKRATCFPGFEGELIGASVTDADVVTDGNITTARGMTVALAFAEELVSLIQRDTESLDDFDEELECEFEIVESESYEQPDSCDDGANAAERNEQDYSKYTLPPTDLMRSGRKEDPDAARRETSGKAEEIIKTLERFGVDVTLGKIERGPRITRYSVIPEAGVRASRIDRLADDIALALSAESVRIESPIPGKNAVGIEIPNDNPIPVMMRELLENEEFVGSPSKTAVCIGKDVSGKPIFGDIAKMPHLLIAGASGMGKSVCINSLITSILYKAKPDEVKLIMIDPKRVELSVYRGLPHLLAPIITETEESISALKWAIDEMNRRYDRMESIAVRSIDAYNERVSAEPELGTPMPKIIIFIDELNDLMIQARDTVESLIMYISQKSRAVGIHLVISTQRASVDVITGVVKANIPSRIACKVCSGIDSRTILEHTGAEKLIGKGDMLFAAMASPSAVRVQGAFVSEDDIAHVVDFIKAQAGADVYDASVTESIRNGAIKVAAENSEADGEDDANKTSYANDRKFINAVELAINNGSVATSFLQRKLRIGYGKAANYIDIMEDLGIVGERCGTKPREVLITLEEWQEILKKLTNT